MTLSRRNLLRTGAAATLGAALPSALMAAPKIRIGAMDGILRMRGKVEVFDFAARLGLEGIEVGLTRAQGSETLNLADPELQARYRMATEKSKVPIVGLVLSTLHENHFKSDKLALKWVHDAIPIARSLRTRVLLLPFFGPAAIQNAAERDHVADLLKDFRPEAEKAGVVLAVENTLTAEDNAALLDRVGSKWVRVYYDVGNSTNMVGVDAAKEIRWLGKSRICQIHLKDTGYLGEGKVNFPDVMRAVRDIGYKGFAVLETSSPSHNVESDIRRNLAYLRGLM
ncbi:MAG: sugar phosphate isomerase/epimerase family protein [Bryobacteraceae bacterium]